MYVNQLFSIFVLINNPQAMGIPDSFAGGGGVLVV